MLATSSFVASLNAVNTSNVSAFVNAVNAVESYSSWIQGQSAPDPDLNTFVTQLKSDAIQWINVIYPLYLQMPNNIASQSNSIDSGLNTLVALQAQYKDNPLPALQTAINQASNSLIQVVQSIASETQNLAGQLQQYSGVLSGKDTGVLSQAEAQLRNDLSAVGNQISANSGRLHQLESATCPDKTAISACESLLQQLSKQFQQYQGEANEFNQISQTLNNAATSLQYLTGYWQQIAADANQCVSSLQQVLQSTGVILTIDWQVNLDNWTNLKSLLQQMYAGVEQFIH